MKQPFIEKINILDRDKGLIHITVNESNGTTTKFSLTIEQVRSLPIHGTRGAFPEHEPVELPWIKNEHAENGHYWITPDHVKVLKEIASGEVVFSAMSY